MKNLYLLLFLFFNGLLSAQTVVKMDMPPQADEQLNVIALFDEEIPEGIPLVMDLMGYNVSGGIAPYSYEWLLNGSVASTNNMITFTPQKGNNLSLKVTDDMGCRAVTSFNLKVARLDLPPEANERNRRINIYPTVVNDNINIEIPGNLNENAVIKIFDISGNLIKDEKISGNKNIKLDFDAGVYFISVEVGNKKVVQKIIAQ